MLTLTQLTWSSMRANAYLHMPLTVGGHFSWPSHLIEHMTAPHPGLSSDFFHLLPQLSSLCFLDYTTPGSTAILGCMTSTVLSDGTSLGPNSGRSYIWKLPQESATGIRVRKWTNSSINWMLQMNLPACDLCRDWDVNEIQWIPAACISFNPYNECFHGCCHS